MKALQIIECAYRGTIEEQDDTIIWLTHSMQDAGADLSLMLCGAAVNYVLEEQDASGLQFGNWKQTRPPRISDEITNLVNKGVPVYVLADDLKRRGISGQKKIDGIQLLSTADIPSLMGSHDRIWFW